MIIENFNIKAVRRALGLELKNVRRERALSQEQLSEAASISTKDINTMEAGKGYLDVYKRQGLSRCANFSCWQQWY